ncbi:MAG: ATP-binding cassette domain-containing protein [Alphaproteobacteria bacterium]|nr:ATP-binding cassette domain-containing protein [Alphaproteobacteria bacterium]
MTAPLLTTHELSKSFGETRALQEVSIEISPGQVYTILGENGSGKSTLVKALAGIIPPDSGQVFLDGKSVSNWTPAGMLKLGITIVLQEILIVPNRTVMDNVLLGHDGLFRHHRSQAEKREFADGQLSRLTDRRVDLDALAGDLELHEQQIVVIARGFARQPRLLILDEATAALDLADRDRLFSAIRTFSAGGGAVAFVSHRMPEILELSDVVYVMHNGRNTANLSGDDINPQTLLAHLTQEGLDV